ILLLAHRVLYYRRDVVAADRLREAEHELRQLLSELARGVVALARILGERLVNDALELRRDLPVDPRDRRNFRALDILDGLEIAIAEEQAPRREQFPEHDPDSEDVRAAVDVLPGRRLGRE